MKVNKVYTFLMVGVLVLVGTGCKKNDLAPYDEQVTSSNENASANVSTDGRLLAFASNEDYEKAISVGTDGNSSEVMRAVEQLHFERYAMGNVAKSEEDKQMDETLGKLLNKDGAIQIGQYIYKVDIQKDSVFAIEVKYKDVAYQDLIDGNTQHKSVVGFSTDEEVLYLVDDRMSKSGEEKKRTWFCRDDGAGSQHAFSTYIYFPNNGWTAAYADYAKFGIYFKLLFEVSSNLNPNRYHVYIQFENLWYKQRCNKQPMGPMSHPWWRNNHGANQIYHSYGSSIQLNGYHVKARARIEDWGQSNGSLPYRTYFSSWAKINVNSPYW